MVMYLFKMFCYFLFIYLLIKAMKLSFTTKQEIIHLFYNN